VRNFDWLSFTPLWSLLRSFTTHYEFNWENSGCCFFSKICSVI
jgi:hypothetical protein